MALTNVTRSCKDTKLLPERILIYDLRAVCHQWNMTIGAQTRHDMDLILPILHDSLDTSMSETRVVEIIPEQWRLVRLILELNNVQ